MKKSILVTTALFSALSLLAQRKNLYGVVVDSSSGQPVSGATVCLLPERLMTMADEQGRFRFSNLPVSLYRVTVTATGYRPETKTETPGDSVCKFSLRQQANELAHVVISSTASSPYKTLMETDIALRGVANSQEILRLVPGLFIGQHQGGGKAEQIFLRGFDADHGTDISIQADGMPVNLPSHAHAQGYADTHFIIPETVQRVDFNKGPYDVTKGDGATGGSLNYVTADRLNKNVLRLEAGQFQTFRGLAMVTLLNSHRPANASWYAASEYSFSNSYFDNPQRFKRFNFFTKFTCRIGERQTLTASASTFWSRWLASGQLPERAVDMGLVNYFGALDPDEGGLTSRTNLNLQHTTELKNGGRFKNQLYYSRYQLDLYSNFSFFLLDPVHGDEIHQHEKRDLAGYNSSFRHEHSLAGLAATTEAGVNLRLDATKGTALSHVVKRYVLLAREKLGDIREVNAAVYVSETVRLSQRLSLQAGLRFDRFYYRYHNRLATDNTFFGTGVFTNANQQFSPKLNLVYQAHPGTQFYVSAGKGFHTNDARAVVATEGRQSIPAAFGADAGVLLKPVPHLFLQAAGWYIYLQEEVVYAGDGGTIEFNGKTRRLGFDVSARYQPCSVLYLDADVNYAHGRAVENAKGEDRIPLAPVWSSTGGIGLVKNTGWNGSLRYRFLGRRPANEDYSLACPAYFVNDFFVNYTTSAFQCGIAVNNLFGVKWKETVFEAETRLQSEPAGVYGLSFTPDTPRNIKVMVSYFFKTKRTAKHIRT